MKRKILLLTLSSTLLASLFISGFSISINNQKDIDVKEVKATTSLNSGIFKLVTDLNELNAYDEVLITSSIENGQNAISGMDNNSLTFYTINDTSSYLTKDNYYIVHNSYAETFEVYKHNDGALGFLGLTDDEGSQSLYNKFITQESYYSLTGHCMGDEGNNSYWYLVSNGDGTFKFKNKEYNAYYIGYNNSNDRFTIFDVIDRAANFSIYKKVRLTNIAVKHKPYHTYYFTGEDKELNGLVIQYNLNDGNSFDVSYEEASHIFSISGSNKTSMWGSVYSDSSSTFNIPIKVEDNPHHTFSKVTLGTDLKDYRGSYLLVYEYKDELYNPKGKVLDNRLETINDNPNHYTKDIVNNQITLEDSWHEQLAVKVVRKDFMGQSRYYLELFENNYLYFDYSRLNDGDGGSNDFDILTTDSCDYNWLVLNEGGWEFKVHYTYNGYYGDTMVRNFVYFTKDYDKKFGLNGSIAYGKVSFFKYDYNDIIGNDVQNFIDAFNVATSNCDPTGESNNLTENDWLLAKEAFEALGPDAQGYLANMTYEHNQEASGSAANIVDRYDYIIAKYDFEDFMLRKLVNTYVNHYSGNSQAFNSLISNDNDSFMVLTVIVGVVSSFVGLLFYFQYKKKHQ